MSNEFNLNVNKRELVNKGARKRALKEGKIPGIYYSHDSKESLPFYIEKKELANAQKADTQIFNISVGGKDRNVLFKSIQYHPVTDEILHVDLYGIKMDQVVSVSVMINIQGTSKGVVEGGILVQNLNELELECLPMDIPQSIDIDISHLEMGDSLRSGDVKLDEKLTITTPEDQIIISVTQPMQEEEAVSTSDEESADGDTEESSGDTSESSESDTSSDSGDNNADG
tara:strand:- start:2468 stop:3151 length:684 start_codon:yes stop_codon:yes gene_type:complete